MSSREDHYRVPTRAIGDRPNELIYRRFGVRVRSGADAGQEAVLQSDELNIGTAEGNHLVLTDSTVSRHHCSITSTPEGPLLRDLGSTNGTFLAGFRIQSAFPKSGASIGIGKTTLTFEGLENEIREALSDDDRYGRALGESPAMRRIFAVLPKIAAADTTILIEGETGTGKTLLADAMHQASPRAAGPFMILDCSAIPPALVESELFGHEKGAFTGAQSARAGIFEAARGGTVFLDEVGELALDMQPKLLRALEERAVRRIGSNSSVRLDVRVIAATNRDVREMVNRGTFRSDLYYRLNTVRVRIPPLRERREDIPLLVRHFYSQFVADGDPEPPAELIDTMTRQDWPGNVRELRSAVERVVLLGEPSLWESTSDVAPSSQTSGPDMFDPAKSFREAKEKAVAHWERWYIEELVRRNDGNLSESARQARMDRNHLRELLRRHNVQIRNDG